MTLNPDKNRIKVATNIKIIALVACVISVPLFPCIAQPLSTVTVSRIIDGDTSTPFL